MPSARPCQGITSAGPAAVRQQTTAHAQAHRSARAGRQGRSARWQRRGCSRSRSNGPTGGRAKTRRRQAATRSAGGNVLHNAHGRGCELQVASEARVKAGYVRGAQSAQAGKTSPDGQDGGAPPVCGTLHHRARENEQREDRGTRGAERRGGSRRLGARCAHGNKRCLSLSAGHRHLPPGQLDLRFPSRSWVIPQLNLGAVPIPEIWRRCQGFAAASVACDVPGGS